MRYRTSGQYSVYSVGQNRCLILNMNVNAAHAAGRLWRSARASAAVAPGNNIASRLFYCEIYTKRLLLTVIFHRKPIKHRY